MTEVKFFKIKRGWLGFRAQGHSGYSDYGEDVVCAAVSALTQVAVLGLRNVLSLDCRVEADEKRGMLFCLLPADLAEEDWNRAQLILEVLYVGLAEISTNEDYQRYVSLKEVSYRED